MEKRKREVRSKSIDMMKNIYNCKKDPLGQELDQSVVDNE